MRAMAFVWSVILVGGITYFSIIGLTHEESTISFWRYLTSSNGAPIHDATGQEG